MIKILLWFIFLILSFDIAAQTVREEKTIPFATYTYTVSEPKNIKLEAKSTTENLSISDVSVDQISNFIGDLKESFCKSLGDADVRVWLNLDAQAKVLVISANAQTGIEVKFHCEKR